MAKINNKKKKSEPHMLDKKDVRCWSLPYYLNQAMMTLGSSLRQGHFLVIAYVMP